MYDEIQRFVNWVRRRNPHARTWRDYGYDLKQFVTVIGDKPPSSVSIQDIDNFITAQSANGLQPATINRHLAAVMSLFTFLSDEDPTLICPVLPHRHTLRAPQRLPRPVPTAAVQQFFAVIKDSRDRAMFLLMLRCGLRIAEVAGLRLRDLYLDEVPPRLRVSGKNSKERTVYLSDQAWQAVQRYLAERPQSTSDAVFLSYQLAGLSTTAIHKRLMRYREAAHIHLTAHQLRHTFANDLVESDVPVTTIQKLLGHAWLATTQTYIAANDRKVQADFYSAAQQLDGWQSEPAQEGQR
ncbi:MAG: tyrosine-type recombinase/integrase [Chloroflexi bacterium]|nr:tyrosine-type recombinase/integrase [Chloroflexota bacterium]